MEPIKTILSYFVSQDNQVRLSSWMSVLIDFPGKNSMKVKEVSSEISRTCMKNPNDKSATGFGKRVWKLEPFRKRQRVQ